MPTPPRPPEWMLRGAEAKGYEIAVYHPCEDVEARRGYCQKKAGRPTTFGSVVTAKDARCGVCYDVDKREFDMREPPCALGNEFVAELHYPLDVKGKRGVNDFFFAEKETQGDKLWYRILRMMESDPIRATQAYMKQVYAATAKKKKEGKQAIKDLSGDVTLNRLRGRMIFDGKSGIASGSRSEKDPFYRDDKPRVTEKMKLEAEKALDEGLLN